MGYGRAIVIGSAQILALFAGISRDRVTMVTGMRRGLSREDAVRFAFLLSTPVIFAAGVRTNTLYPFGIYCLIAGLASVVYLSLIK